MKGRKGKCEQKEKVIKDERKGNTVRDRREEGKGNGKGKV